jgi:hypothetical protein
MEIVLIIIIKPGRALWCNTNRHALLAAGQRCPPRLAFAPKASCDFTSQGPEKLPFVMERKMINSLLFFTTCLACGDFPKINKLFVVLVKHELNRYLGYGP